MEIWLSPALGFDYAAQQAVVFGDGSKKVSWISSGDVAQAIVAALSTDDARRRTLELGGPDPLGPLEVIAIFEAAGWGKFTIQHVPEQKLAADYAAAEDPVQKTFAALQLQCASGDPIDMTPTLETLPMRLTSVAEYAAALKKSSS